MTVLDSETRVLDADEALGLLRRAAAGREDFVYPRRTVEVRSGVEDARCDYVRDEKPSCLVGQALALAGAPVEALKVLDVDVSGDPRLSIGAGQLHDLEQVRQQTGHLDLTLPFVVSLEAALVLADAQSAQDNGDSWGRAIREAERMLGVRRKLDARAAAESEDD